MFQDDATIATVLTPAGRGAIATIRVRGVNAIGIVSHLLQTAPRPALALRPWRTIVFGRWGDAAGEELVASCLDADQVEIHCHGGVAAVAKIVADLEQNDCDIERWQNASEGTGNFAAQNAWRQAALIALSAARTERTAGILLDQFGGAGERAIREILAVIEAANREQALQLLDELLSHAALGLHLVQPWSVVLAGRPNVGKSSLINALLGYRRAIVFDTPGTTRDIVTGTTACEGWPIELSDTAGWRDEAGSLELQGIAAAKAAANRADLVLLVADRSQAWTDEDDALEAACPTSLRVWNKSDLHAHSSAVGRPGIAVSALAGSGVAELLQNIAQRLVPMPPTKGAAVPFTSLQIAALHAAHEAIVRGALSDARAQLQHLV